MNYKLLRDMITKRRSVRQYRRTPISEDRLELVYDAIDGLVPLYPEIKTRIEVISRKNIHTTMLWAPESVVVLFSEVKDGYLPNAGFMLGQLDLALQAIGLGTCYIGLARMGSRQTMAYDASFEYVMCLAIGETDVPKRGGEGDFNRKALLEICEGEDQRVLPMRFAASSMNTQSWYVVPSGDKYRLYRRQISRSKDIKRMNHIDVGIALSHLFVTYPDSFGVAEDSEPPVLNNFDYILSFKL